MDSTRINVFSVMNPREGATQVLSAHRVPYRLFFPALELQELKGLSLRGLGLLALARVLAEELS